MQGRFLCILALVSVVATARPAGACPSASGLAEALASVDLATASRTARFESALPRDLYAEATRKIGRAVAARDGDRVFGVLVAERPIVPLWKALNDEDHHALDGRYVPVRTSRVIDGDPRGQSRLLLQSFDKLGIGRWWVSRVWMNRELFAASGGRLWEIVWEDRMAEVDRTIPPVSDIAADLRGIDRSRGSWLLVPLADRCTLVEYFSWTEPGGFVGATQALVARKAVRDTIEGVVRLADEHIAVAPHSGPPFVRPDGTPLD
jgi:hypothetical protein